MTIAMNKRASIARPWVLGLAVLTTLAAALLAQPPARAASRAADPFAQAPRQHVTQPEKDLMKMSENKTPPGAAEMAAAKAITMKVLAIGTEAFSAQSWSSV